MGRYVVADVLFDAMLWKEVSVGTFWWEIERQFILTNNAGSSTTNDDNANDQNVTLYYTTGC
jgi:hypothetical protein